MPEIPFVFSLPEALIETIQIQLLMAGMKDCIPTAMCIKYHYNYYSRGSSQASLTMAASVCSNLTCIKFLLTCTNGLHLRKQQLFLMSWLSLQSWEKVWTDITVSWQKTMPNLPKISEPSAPLCRNLVSSHFKWKQVHLRYEIINIELHAFATIYMCTGWFDFWGWCPVLQHTEQGT